MMQWRRSLTDLPLRTQGLLVVALPVMALLIAVINLAFVYRQEQEAEHWVNHTVEVRSAVETMQTLAADAETGTRGYLLTRRRQWLRDSEDALKHFAPVLSHLERLLQDNPSQMAKVRQVHSLSDTQFRRLAALRRLVDRRGPDESLQAALETSRDSREALRRVLKEMRTGEEELLAQRRAHAEHVRMRMYVLIVANGFFGLLGGVLAPLLFGSAIVRRIERLTSNAQLLAERKPLLPARPGEDEIGRLTRAIGEADALLAKRERELRETHRFLEHLIETSPTIVFQQDPATMRVTYVSPNVKRILGYAPKEILDMPDFWAAHIHPQDRARILEEDRKTLEARTGQIETEYRLRHKDGEYHWFRSFVHLEYDEQGKPSTFLGHRLDITRRKVAEEALMERQVTLDAANQELEAFSYSVSHDLRAPLRSIDGFGLALLEEYGDRLDAAGMDYLIRVRAATQRMGILINDLLKLSRVTLAPIHREEVDMSRFAGNIAQELRQGDPARQVEFLIQPGMTANGDPGLLRLVLENLFSNAWKFTARRDGGRIEFRSAQRQIGPTTYLVRDNGAGFDPACAGQLFRAFQRLHATNQFAGTGIGLATVQRIIHRHGGRIWAEGEVDQGATFYFTLAPEPAESTAA